MNAEKNSSSIRIYRVAGVCALLSCFLWPMTLLAQAIFVSKMTVSRQLWDEGFFEVLSVLFEEIRNARMTLSYDVTHLPGMLILPLFLVLFALVCFRARERTISKKNACLLAGLGLEAYSLCSFACHILLAVSLYRKEWLAGVSHSAIIRILFTAFGSGFAELAVISLFALSLLYVGKAGKNRALAVAAGAMCIYRLFEDSLWLVTGMFDGTLANAPSYQIAHGILFFFAMLLTLFAAVLVAMASTKESDPEDLQPSKGKRSVPFADRREGVS